MRILLELSCIGLGVVLYHKKYKSVENRDPVERRIGYWMSVLFIAIGFNLLLWNSRPMSLNGIIPLGGFVLGSLGYMSYKKYRIAKEIEKKVDKTKNTYYIEQVLGSFCCFAIGLVVIADGLYYLGQGKLEANVFYSIYEVMITLMVAVMGISFSQLKAYVQQDRLYKISSREKMVLFKKKLNSNYEKL